MKRILSLIISVSLLLQVIPTGGMVTYASEEKSAYGYDWEQEHSLDRNLAVNRAIAGSTEALVSWTVPVNPEGHDYTLDYIIENNEVEDKVEKIRFTFNQETNNKAKASIEVLNLDGAAQKKDYRVFNFSGLGEWKEEKDQEKISLDITAGTRYRGGRVQIGGLEIRFRWADGKVHFQTNQIKYGNITPFSLRRGNAGPLETVNILTGVEGYSISPVHIELAEDGSISNKEVITIPGDGEKPGSKPGIQIDFKRPKKWDQDKFVILDDASAQRIRATLDLADLTDATTRLQFNLGEERTIKDDKELMYDRETNTYSLYLAENDQGHKNVVKWDQLDESMILKTVQLSLIMRAGISGEKGEALGNFAPQPATKGRHTYLGYTIGRSSMEEAFIEIQPYNGAKNTEFTYIVESALDFLQGAAKWEPLVEHKHMTAGDNAEKPFTIPVPFSSNHENQYYKITTKYNEVPLNSQILHYQPNEDLTIPPPTPVIQSIDNIYVVPPKKTGDQPETIGFDLTWSAPKNTTQNKLLQTLLEQGNIYYELFFHESLESTDERGTLAKVFQVGLDADGQIGVSSYKGTAGKTPAEIRYNPSKDTFTMENIVLKNPGQTGWEQLELKDPEIDLEYEKGRKYPDFNVTNKMPGQEVPGIYYLTMKALYETTGAAIQMGVSNKSNAKSITISPLEEVIPVASKIESKDAPVEGDPDRIRQLLSWGNISVERYIKQMLDPLNLEVDNKEKAIYEIYLYQNKNLKDSSLKKAEAVKTDLDKTEAYKLMEQDIKALREGQVIRLDYPGSSHIGVNNILLDGLDPNQVYYSKIRVRLDIKNKDGGEVEEAERYSVFSKAHSFTTSIKVDPPGPGERVPPVPENLQIIDQNNNTTAKIAWNAPDYSKQEDESIYYEMIRLDSRTLATEEDNRLLSIKNLVGNDKKNEMEAWRTKGLYVDEYLKTSDTWSKAKPEQSSSRLELEDTGLNPNNIYYYYVRTVLVVEGEEVHSSWVGLPVTTDPIKKPMGLKIENKEAYPHDPKREIVISFLAPIPKGANIPKDYDFDIAVLGELDEDYKLDYARTRVTSKEKSEDTPTGYSHFVYKINNTIPGKRYDLKVRITDKTIEQVNGEYPKSLYSNRVTTRTHFDQDEQDKDHKFAEYLRHFEDQVEALRRKAYWTLEDSANKFSVKYRSNYIIPQITSQKTYKLEAREGVTDFTYYMPASVISSGNLNQTSFEIKQGNISYSIRPSTITNELEELKEALEDIKAKNIRDYYISFNFKQLAPRISPGIDKALSPEIIVDTELVRLKEEDLLIEDHIMSALGQEIQSEKVRFIDDLERALDRGKILDEELQVIIDRSIKAIKKNHQKDVKDILRRTTRNIKFIDKWKNSMLIMATVEGNVLAQGYKLGWQDTPLSTFNIGLGYAIEINQSGIYIFKGEKINMPVIPGVGGASNLVAKYQLTDFLGINGQINPSQTVSKRNVLGAMARVMGAPRGADYIQYLKQSNIQGINNIGMDLPIKKGEGIYLLMQVYEKTFKKPINTVHIKNRNIVPNIRLFNQLHQPYVLVGADTKIISGGSGIRPNDQMQNKDLLEILSNIMATAR